jgi:uncharacterized membrane protein YhiD involved in acid resistance
MNRPTWVLVAGLRTIAGLLVGLGGIVIVQSQNWPSSLAMIASGIVAGVGLLIIGYRTESFDQYVERRNKLKKD